MDAVRMAFVALENRPQLLRLWELLQPVLAEAKHVAPDVTEIVRELAPKFFPEMQQAIAESAPLAQFGTKWLQQSLKTLGYELNVDGDYGPATKKAVSMFQAEHMGPSKVDGWAGIATCVAVYNKLEGKK